MVPPIEVVGVAADGKQTERLCSLLRPDVVLLDTMLPGEPWASVTNRIKERYSDVRVLLFAEDADEKGIAQALAVGASGMVLKTAHVRDMIQAIVDVARGGLAVDVNLGGAKWADESSVLSDRETEVLGLLARGLSNKQVAVELFISQATVKRHIENISRKLGVSQRSALVAEGFRRGLVT